MLSLLLGSRKYSFHCLRAICFAKPRRWRARNSHGDTLRPKKKSPSISVSGPCFQTFLMQPIQPIYAACLSHLFYFGCVLGVESSRLEHSDGSVRQAAVEAMTEISTKGNEEAIVGVRDCPYGICCPWVRGGWDLDALEKFFRFVVLT